MANVKETTALAVQLEGGYHHTTAMCSRNTGNIDQVVSIINTSVFVKNGPCITGLGLGSGGWTTMIIATPTGEGVANA